MILVLWNTPARPTVWYVRTWALPKLLLSLPPCGNMVKPSVGGLWDLGSLASSLVKGKTASRCGPGLSINNCRETACILVSHIHPVPHAPCFVICTLYNPVLRKVGWRKLHQLASTGAHVSPSKPTSFTASSPDYFFGIDKQNTEVFSDLGSLHNTNTLNKFVYTR